MFDKMSDKIIVHYKLGILFLTGVCCFATGYLWGIVIGVITLMLSAIQVIGIGMIKNGSVDEDKLDAIYDEDATFDDVL